MRFGLLIVLTIALVSVAFRINSHDTSSQSRPPSRPAGIPSTRPSAPPTSPFPTTAASSPGSGSPTPGVLGRAVRRHPTSGQLGTAKGQQILPVTGWGSAMKLGALALLLIGSGAMVVRVGTPRRQPADTVHN